MERIETKTTTEVIATLDFLSREEIINLFVRYMSSESITSKKFAEFLVKAYGVNPKDLGFGETITNFENVTSHQLHQRLISNYIDVLRGYNFKGLLEQHFDRQTLYDFSITLFSRIKDVSKHEARLFTLFLDTRMWESNVNPLNTMDVREQINTFMNLNYFHEEQKKEIMVCLYRYATKQIK